MRIGTPQLSSDDEHATWSVAVQGLPDTPDRLWFRLPEQHAGLVTQLADPAVIGLLVPAMHAVEPMEVSGPVTDELSHNLLHGYQHILEAVIPTLTQVTIDSPNTVEAADPAPGVATGFSAGVDSYAVLADHHFLPVPKALRLTHLTFFNVGSLTPGERGRRLFSNLHDLLAPVTEKIGLPFIPVDSNLDDFYVFGNYQQTYGPRIMSAASLLQRGIGRYYFAGSVHNAYLGVHRSHGTGASDPISIPLLTTRQFRPIPHGNQYTRVEKTLIVADMPASHTSLNVCVDPMPDGRNCSRCHKCLRTELTLEIAGRLSEYRGVFDLSTYQKARTAFLDRIVVAGDYGYEAEIRDQARRAGFPLPSVQMALARRVARVPYRKARSIGRSIRSRLPRQQDR